MIALSFLRPWLLLMVPLMVPIVAALWYLNFRIRQKARRLYGEPRLVDKFSRPMRLREELLSLILWLSVISLLTIAAAGPTIPDAQANVPIGSEQVILVEDVSRSMFAEDFRPYLTNATSPAPGTGPFGNRVDMVRHVIVTQIMPALAGNELGIVTYSGKGWIQADLMTDFDSMRWVLKNWVKPGSAPGEGSDYAEGLKTAVSLFLEAGEANGKNRTIVLFSDGGFTGTPENLNSALKLLRENDIDLIIVGVGSRDVVALPNYTKGQQTGFLKDKSGATANASLEEGNLLALRTQSQGRYILLEPTAPLEIEWATALTGSRLEDRGADVYHYPLAAAMVLSLVVFLRGLIRRISLWSSKHSMP